jgi:hypothetical protein
MARPKNDERHEALPARIRLWMLDHPGEHRARDIAEGLGVPAGMTRAKWSQKVANALVRLASDGSVARTEVTPEGWKVPVGVYSLQTAATAPTGSD